MDHIQVAIIRAQVQAELHQGRVRDCATEAMVQLKKGHTALAHSYALLAIQYAAQEAA
jgi:hypothetical protein